MAKDGKHVIYAGGIFANPQLHREGAASTAFFPGTITFFDAGKVSPAVDGSEPAILYVANFDYLRCKTVDDAFAPNDWVINFHPTPGVFLNVRATAGTCKKGDPVSIVSGQVKVTKTTDDGPIFAYVEEDQAVTVAAGDLVRVVFK